MKRMGSKEHERAALFCNGWKIFNTGHGRAAICLFQTDSTIGSLGSLGI